MNALCRAALGLALGLAPVLTGPLAAQSMSTFSAAKAAATHAVAATNAHTAAMQATSPASGPGSAPAAPRPASSPAAPASPAASPGSPSATAGPGATGSDTGARTISVTEHGVRGELSLNREVFSYDRGGRRDPFVSLLKNGDLRPMLSDLRLVTVLYDPAGRNSIAVMHDASSPGRDQYRVRVGQMLGRMRVSEIDPKQVVFTIEEIGYNRQAVLALGDSTQARTQ
jgi:hypothetical protein